MRCCLNFNRLSSKGSFFLVVSSKQSYCFALNNAWWMALGEMYELEGLCQLVLMSKMESFVNLSLLNTVVLRKLIWLFDISAVNLTVGWK